MTSPTADTLPKTIPAATVVIFRNNPEGGAPQILMVQRAKELRFAGGAAVFPGGRIDPADRELASRIAPDADQDVAAARVAGIRETLEETGLVIGIDRKVSVEDALEARRIVLETGALLPVIERMGWQLNLEALVPFARWRPNWEGAFDTRFFLADLGTGAVDIAVDATENTRLFWTTAQNALNGANNGEISVIFPTRRNLDRLALYNSYADAAAHADQFPKDPISPRQEVRDGETWLCIPEAMGYPVTAERMATVKRG